MTGEGRISTGGLETWYRVVGDPTGPHPRKLPVLALHGGPGLPHESLEPLEAMADGGRPVVLYDQLGCGNSTRPADPELWGVAPFLGELSAVRRELGLQRIHLLGHSWGGMLAMEHALAGADGLASLVLVGAVVSGPMVFECRQRFYGKLPPGAREAIRRHEAAGTFDDPEYGEAMDLFYRRYACPLDPWPDWLNRALSKMYVGRTPPCGASRRPRAARHPGPQAQPRRHWGADARRCRPARRHDLGPGTGDPGGHPGLGARDLRGFLHYPFAEERERFLATLDGFLTHAERQTGP